jgi:uncharacterized protein involved in outer membrane biogenesis
VKKIFLVFGLFVVLFAAVLAGPGLIDWNQYKNEIQDQVRNLTGRNININGDISITILPALALIANDVSLANINGAKAENLLQLKSLEVRVALAPLLGGQVTIERVKLVDPVFELEAMPDGRQNWLFETKENLSRISSVKAPQSLTIKSENELTKNPETSSQFIALDNLSVKNGTIIYRDSVSGTFEKIEAIDANFSAASIKGPFKSSGGFVVRGVPITFYLNVGEIIHGRTVAFSLKAEAIPGDAKMLLAGTLSGLRKTPRIKGSIKGEAKSLEAFIKATQGGSLPSFLGQAFSFDANITAQADGAKINGLELNLGNTKASGSIDVKISKTPSVAVHLSTGHVDIDKWLSSQKKLVPPETKYSLYSSLDGPLLLGSKTGSKLKSRSKLIIPKSLQASLTLIAEMVTYRGGVIRNGRVNAELSNGEITLSQLSAQFPGGSDVALFGFVTSKNDKLQFEGELESTVNDLRGFLGWLGQDFDSVSRDRLRKLSLATRVSASPDQIKLKEIKLQFDSSRISGGVTLALRKRPSFGANFIVNKFNLDAYLPKKEQKTIKKRSVANIKNIGDPKKATADATKNKNNFQRLNFLNELDANLKIQVKSLMFRERIIKNAIFDGTLYNGKLDIRRLSADRLISSSLFVKGKIDNFGKVPKATELSLKVETNGVNRLLEFMGLNSIPELKNLGAVKFYGKFDGPVLAPNVKLNLNSLGALVKVSGQLDGLSIVPAVKGLKFQIKAKDTSKLLKLAGIKAITARQLGALDVGGEINGNLIAPSLAFKIKAVGGSATGSGKINILPIGDALDLSVRVRHPELARLLRVMGGYNPASKLGRLDIQGRLIGGSKSVSMTDIIAKAGSVDLRGKVEVGFGGLRSQINANLTGGNIVIDPFLPKKRRLSYWLGLKIRPVATRRGGTSWSTDPIDLSRLADIDANVVLKSPSISFKAYNLQNADLSFILENGNFRTKKLNGVLFGGSLKASAETTLNSRPRLKVVLAVEGIDLEQTTRALTGSPVASGKMGLQVNLNSVGGSEVELVNSLGGNGSLRLEGVNVRKGKNGTMLAGALGLAASMTQVSGLFGSVKNPSSLVDISSSFTIRSGIAMSRDIRIASGLGEGAATGVVDIPRWGIDVKGNVKLSQNILTDIVSRGTRKNITQTLPFVIYGKIDSPSIKLDTSKITGSALRIPGADKLLKKLPKGVGGVLQGILGGRLNKKEKIPNSGDASRPSQSQQQEKINPVDIMKEIFRRR